MTPCPPRSSHHRRRRRGYVLVMVLGLLVLAASLLVAVSRAALRTTIAARSAEDDLQRRWGLASCRKAILPNVEQILSALEQERRQPAPAHSATVRLGRYRFELILADEQAKANVNAMLAIADAARVEARVREGLSGAGLVNRVKLRPTYGAVVQPVSSAAGPTTASASRPILPVTSLSVGSWGQVFDNVPPAQLVRPLAGSRLAAADLLTCWGNGGINVRRAPDAALTLAAGRALSGIEIGRLVDARNKLFDRKAGESFDAPAADQLQELVTKTSAQALKNRGNIGLLERSTCHSLWVISRDGRRERYDLFVSDESDPRRPVTQSFSW